MKLLIEEREENKGELQVTIKGDAVQLGYLHFEATNEIIDSLKKQGVPDKLIAGLLSQSIVAINDLGGKIK